MKPVLTFTNYFEELSNSDLQLEIIGVVGDIPVNVVVGLTPNITYNNKDLDNLFRTAMQDFCFKAIQSVREENKDFPNPSGMLLMDMLSLFEIKRAVPFINGMVKHNRDSSVILEAIW